MYTLVFPAFLFVIPYTSLQCSAKTVSEILQENQWWRQRFFLAGATVGLNYPVMVLRDERLGGAMMVLL